MSDRSDVPTLFSSPSTSSSSSLATAFTYPPSAPLPSFKELFPDISRQFPASRSLAQRRSLPDLHHVQEERRSSLKAGREMIKSWRKGHDNEPSPFVVFREGSPRERKELDLGAGDEAGGVSEWTSISLSRRNSEEPELSTSQVPEFKRDLVKSPESTDFEAASYLCHLASGSRKRRLDQDLPTKIAGDSISFNCSFTPDGERRDSGSSLSTSTSTTISSASWSPSQLQLKRHQQKESSSEDSPLLFSPLSLQPQTSPPVDSKRQKRASSSSCASLIAQAISSSKNEKMSLKHIYSCLNDSDPFKYALNGINTQSWRNTVRHNLSINDVFIKAETGGNGRAGGLWTLDPELISQREQGS